MRAKRRLRKIADLVFNQNCVADIGSDHGFLTKILIEENRAKKVIATDISSKSLEKTKLLSQKFGFESKVDLRVGDGLEPLFENEVDLVVIAGMGGHEIIRILKTQNLKNVKNFIFAPAQNVSELREFLCENGFEIVYDDVTKDQKKFYFTLSVIQNGAKKKVQKEQILFGIQCQNCKNGDFFEFLTEFIKKRKSLISQKLGDEKIHEEFELGLELLNKIKQENYYARYN